MITYPETNYSGTNYRNIINVQHPTMSYDAHDGYQTRARDHAQVNTAMPGDGTDGNTMLNNFLTWLQANGDGGILYFPEGTYCAYDCYTSTTKGISFIGETNLVWNSVGQTGATFKRSPGGRNVRMDPWERVLTLDGPYTGEVDSGVYAFNNMIIDGDAPYAAFLMNFTGNPTTGDTFTIDRDSITARPYDTYTFGASNNPATNTIAIGGSISATMDNVVTVMTANGYTVFKHATLNNLYIDRPTMNVGYIYWLVSSTAFTLTFFEQSHMITAGLCPGTCKGRTVIKVEACKMQNHGWAEVLSLMANTDVDIYKLDDNHGGAQTFGRGMVVFGGTYSAHKVKDVTFDLLHCEYDCTGHDGSGASSEVIQTLQNITGRYISFSTGNCATSQVTVDNVVATEGYVITGNSIPFTTGFFNITNCDFQDNGRGNALQWPYRITFDDTHFRVGPNYRRADNGGFTHALNVIFKDAIANGRITLNDCHFHNDYNVGSGGSLRMAIVDNQNGDDYLTRDNRIIMNSPVFHGYWDSAFGNGAWGTGGYFEMTGIDVTQSDLFYMGIIPSINNDATTGSRAFVSIDAQNADLSKLIGYAWIRICTHAADLVLLSQNVILTAAHNFIWLWDENSLSNVTLGRPDGQPGIMRTITGTGTTAQGTGFKRLWNS